jgi:hypothetical protein
MITTSEDFSLRIFEIVNTLFSESFNFFSKSQVKNIKNKYCSADVTAMYPMNYEGKLVFTQMENSKLFSVI